MKLLVGADVPLLRRTLLQDPYYNLFMIGNLEAMGIHHKDLFYWGQFVGDDLIGVAMRCRRNWLFYDAGGADLNLFARAVDVYPEDGIIGGRALLVGAITDRLRQYTVVNNRDCRYCVLPLDNPLSSPTHPARRATKNDLAALVRFYADAGEMYRDREAVRLCLDRNRIYLIEVKGCIVSAALTNVETPTMAMIGGVYTPKHLRSRGYARSAMTALCASLMREGIEPCLFYDNPAAGTVYHHLGFEDIGPWRLARLRRQGNSDR